MCVMIYPWNIIQLCRTFTRDKDTTKRYIVTFEVKNLRNNRQKSIISNFDDNWRQWWACDCWHLSIPLRWLHNGHDGVSNHQPHDCLLNRLFRRRSKKTPKLRVTGLCVGNSPGTGEFPAQMASNAEKVSIWWRHHAVIWYTSMSLHHPCCHSSRNDILYQQRENVPGSQLLSYRFATS